jgi:heme exporter protein B
MSVPFFQQVLALTLKEARLEWRLKYALGGIALYLLAIVLLIFLTFEQLEDRVWVLLFWMAVLFTAANAVAKSFLLEGEGRRLYYYTVASAEAVMMSKIIYNFCLMMILALLGLGLFAAMMGFPPDRPGLFLGTVVLGSGAFALVFTMVSAIASGASNSGTLVAILGFPVLVPVIRLLTALSMLSLLPKNVATSGLGPGQGLLLLAGIDVLVLAFAMVLFPYLWRD